MDMTFRINPELSFDEKEMLCDNMDTVLRYGLIPQGGGALNRFPPVGMSATHDKDCGVALIKNVELMYKSQLKQLVVCMGTLGYVLEGGWDDT